MERVRRTIPLPETFGVVAVIDSRRPLTHEQEVTFAAKMQEALDILNHGDSHVLRWQVCRPDAVTDK